MRILVREKPTLLHKKKMFGKLVFVFVISAALEPKSADEDLNDMPGAEYCSYVSTVSCNGWNFPSGTRCWSCRELNGPILDEMKKCLHLELEMEDQETCVDYIPPKRQPSPYVECMICTYENDFEAIPGKKPQVKKCPPFGFSLDD